jgi:cell division septation protein DedD
MLKEAGVMNSNGPFAHRRPKAGSVVAASIAVLTVGGLLVAASAGAQAATSVGLGTVGSFAVIAGAGITNTGPTTTTGDIGTFPTTSITGLASMTVNGTNQAGDAVTQSAKNDLVTAYDSAAGQGPTVPISGELGGMTLVSGVYNSASSLGLTGTLTLDAAGNPNSVFVFQAGSSLTTASGSQVALINGAQACNVFWQVGSSATLGTGSAFRGTVMALTSITLTTGATVDGRVLARNGAVTLDTNTITRSTCSTSTPATASAVATPTASATPTPTPSATPTPTPTPTPTVSAPARPTASTKPSTPQVSVTPSGGVGTGDNSIG